MSCAIALASPAGRFNLARSLVWRLPIARNFRVPAMSALVVVGRAILSISAFALAQILSADFAHDEG